MLPILFVTYFYTTQKVFTYINEIFGRLLFKLMSIPGFWTLKITDRRKLKDFKGQYVIVSNHVSFMDTLVIWHLPVYKKFILAAKFIKIPIFGQLCWAGGHVTVNRFDPNTTVDAVDKAYLTIQDGSSLVVYPEGRRSESQDILLPFKTGAFRVAQRANIPILPITLIGTGKALPVGGMCDVSQIEMIIDDPIEVSSDHSDIKSHPSIERVYNLISNNLGLENNSKN